MNRITGRNIVGVSSNRARIENDFYATPIDTTIAILKKEKLEGSILEPAAGQRHILKALEIENYLSPHIYASDLIERKNISSFEIISDRDFLTYHYDTKYDNIITNPPFEYAREFIEKSIPIFSKKIIIFAKIQLLEGMKRKALFEKFPPKYVYVFTRRQNPLRDGNEVDENGKKWASTMCFAWFVWYKNEYTEPTVRWL